MSPDPRISICEVTTLHASLEEDLVAYAAAGATGIGLCEVKLPGDDAASAALVRASGLTVTHAVPEIASILAAGPMIPGPRAPRERVDMLCRAIERLAAFEPVACLCLTGPVADLRVDEARAHVVAGLRRAARVADACGMRLALEPSGPQFAPDWSLIDGIVPAVALLDEVDDSNLGLLVDVWHLWNSPTFAEDVQRHADRIVGYHIGDRRAVTRGLWDRVLPGDGVAQLPAKLRAIEESGFDGWYDIEIFSDDGVYGTPYDGSLWRLPSDELARKAVEGFASVWSHRHDPSHAES